MLSKLFFMAIYLDTSRDSHPTECRSFSSIYVRCTTLSITLLLYPARTSTCLRVVTWSVLGIDNLESPLLSLVTIQGLENPRNNLPSSREFVDLCVLLMLFYTFFL